VVRDVKKVENKILLYNIISICNKKIMVAQKNNTSKVTDLILQDKIEKKIFIIRDKKVMIDKDLAELYRVETGALNRQVKRNIERFPADFMFQLTKKEFKNLKCHFGTSSWGGTRKLPYAFTENGVAMLSSVLRSQKAIYVNIQIMRTFTKIREIVSSHKELKREIESYTHEKQIKNILGIIKRMLEPPTKSEKKIGFKP